MRFMVITMCGPMMSFGGAIIDGAGNTGRLPRLSAITGLLANAVGYDRTDFDRLAGLQDSIVYAAREDVSGELSVDFQTAKLEANDKSWMRAGIASRAGGGNTYNSPALLTKPYLADHAVTVVVGFVDDEARIEQLISSLSHPARPLFLGRKAFPPSVPLIDRTRPVVVEANNALEALRIVPKAENGKANDLLACWPENCGEGRSVEVRDIRDFVGNRHAGSRLQREGRISVIAA